MNRWAILVTTCLVAGFPAAALAQSVKDPAHPVVPVYGAITPAPDAAGQPDPSLTYRVVFDITDSASDPNGVNLSLQKVARFLNLLGSAHVAVKPGDVVAVIHGPATSLVLSDAASRARQGRPNPNSALLAALRAAGVEVHVCSQALGKAKIGKDDLAPEVTLDLSAMTTLATLQLKGWALIPE